MFGGCLDGVWWVSRGCFRVYGGCLDGVWMVSGRYLWDIQMVCGVSRYLKGKSGLVRQEWSSQDRSSQDISSQNMSSQDRLSQDKSSQDRSSQDR